MKQQLHKLLDLVLEAKEKGIQGTIDFSQHVNCVAVRFFAGDGDYYPIFDYRAYYDEEMASYISPGYVSVDDLIKKTEEYIKNYEHRTIEAK